MAEDQKFGNKVNNYAEQYEAAIRKNAKDFQKVASECIDRGIKTVDKVLEDASKAKVQIGKEFIEKYNITKEQIAKAKVYVKDKINDAKDYVVDTVAEAKDYIADKAGQAKDYVVGKAEQAKDTVVGAKNYVIDKSKEAGRKTVDGAAKAIGATVAVARIGTKLTIKGAKTAGEKGKQAYKATKGTAQKGLEAVSKWFKARGKQIKDFIVGNVTDAKDYVADKTVDARNFVKNGIMDTIKDVKDFASTVESRKNISVQKLARSAKQTFSAFCDKLEANAISKEERNQKARADREAEQETRYSQTQDNLELI